MICIWNAYIREWLKVAKNVTFWLNNHKNPQNGKNSASIHVYIQTKEKKNSGFISIIHRRNGEFLPPLFRVVQTQNKWNNFKTLINTKKAPSWSNKELTLESFLLDTQTVRYFTSALRPYILHDLTLSEEKKQR